MDIFGKIASFEPGNKLIAICRIKLITKNHYSPTKESLFCWLKLLTDLSVEEQLRELNSRY
jgi:hypothetical protein